MIIRAISIKQPYAEQILRGVKTREFRGSLTNIRERVWIYASLRPADNEAAWRSAGERPGSLPTGVIVGSVKIVAVTKRVNGGFAYHLEAPRRARHRRPRNQPQPRFWIPKF